MRNYLKDKKYLVILVLSTLSLLPMIFFILNLESLLNIADIKKVNENLIKDTLSKSITNWTILFPFLVGLITWTGNAVLSAYWLHKKAINPIYAYATLIFGGLGIHWLVILFLAFNKIQLKSLTTKWLNIISISVIGLLSTIAIAPFIAIKVTKHADTPVQGEPIQMSLDENNPNLIEVFSDGLDRSLMMEYILKDNTFKDFNYFNRFMTAGTLTHRSLPVLWGGKEYNTFNIMSNYDLTPHNAPNVIYGKYFLETGVKHMRESKTSFEQRSIVNTTSWSDNSGYAQVSSGTAYSVKQKYPEFNITNWSGARDGVYGKWGVSKFSPDKVAYEWLGENMQVANNQKGARVLVNDLITHRPYQLGSNGKFSLTDYSTLDQIKNLADIYSSLITKLKAVKGIVNGKEVSAYDNTMIVFYGDHSSHELVTNEGTEIANNLRHAESLLMIKYPHKVKTKTNVINDKYVYSAELNGIVNYYFNHQNLEPLDYFDDSKFDNRPRPVFVGDDKYLLAKWEDDSRLSASLGQKIVPAGHVVEWNENDKEKLAKEVTALMEE